jgi:hypothetical protein
MLTRFVSQKKIQSSGVFFVGLKWCHWPINTSAKAITFLKVVGEIIFLVTNFGYL